MVGVGLGGGSRRLKALEARPKPEHREYLRQHSPSHSKLARGPAVQLTPLPVSKRRGRAHRAESCFVCHPNSQMELATVIFPRRRPQGRSRTTDDFFFDLVRRGAPRDRGGAVGHGSDGAWGIGIKTMRESSSHRIRDGQIRQHAACGIATQMVVSWLAGRIAARVAVHGETPVPDPQ